MIAAIQAGGRSLRMGEDKAWVVINGRPMIEHVLMAATEAAERLLIVVNPANPTLPRYEQLAAQWNAELLFDQHDYRGPLGGLETALQQCTKDESLFLLACDMPFLTPEFLQLLRTIHQDEQNELTLPLDATEQPQMLASLYAARCLPAVQSLLAANQLKARLLPEHVKTRVVRCDEYAHLRHADRLLLNVNTPEDYRNLPA